MPSVMVATMSAGRLPSSKKSKVEPQKTLEDLRFSPSDLEAVDLRPPQCPPLHAHDYTDEMLEVRRFHADVLRSDRYFKTSTSTRYAGCYSYYLTKVQRMAAEATNENDGCTAQLQRQRLQICRQILMFDQSNSTQNHPCTLPRHEFGDKLLTCTTVMLKYVIYTRYQYYLGRKLNSLSFAVRPELVNIWRNAYKKLKDEMVTSDEAQTDYSEISWESHESELPVNDLLRRIGDMLRLKRFTIENAIRSLEKYSRHRFLLWTDGCESPEVPTYELEDLVQSGSTELLAHTLYSDFVALDAMKKFATDDIDIVHLQAVISGFIRTFFDVRCSMGEDNHDVSSWVPTTLLNVQQYHLGQGDRRFQQRVRWLVQSEAERAERKFWKGWTALCRDDGRNQRDVQELLSTYLQTIGVEKAPEMSSTSGQGRMCYEN